MGDDQHGVAKWDSQCGADGIFVDSVPNQIWQDDIGLLQTKCCLMRGRASCKETSRWCLHQVGVYLRDQ